MLRCRKRFCRHSKESRPESSPRHACSRLGAQCARPVAAARGERRRRSRQSGVRQRGFDLGVVDQGSARKDRRGHRGARRRDCRHRLRRASGTHARHRPCPQPPAASSRPLRSDPDRASARRAVDRCHTRPSLRTLRRGLDVGLRAIGAYSTVSVHRPATRLARRRARRSSSAPHRRAAPASPADHASRASTRGRCATPSPCDA